jgi:hypothetical protein
VYQIVPEVEIVNLAVDSIERSEISHRFVSGAGEVDGILAAETVARHQPNGDSTHDWRHRNFTQAK